jgi:2-iminobutanoate/2-iminopropanoate deaminase
MTGVRVWNPEGLAPPASRYSHCAVTEGAGRFLAISGQLGLRPDGSLAEGFAGQIDQCLANIDTALASAGMGRQNLMRLTVYATDTSAEAVALYRARRDAWIGASPPPAATYVVVAGLAAPVFLVEVEALAFG